MQQKPTTFYPKNSREWRAWLQENHLKEKSVWVIFYRVQSDKPSITWAEAVREALCFGWIDSTKKRIDNESYMQFYSRRKAFSTWSKINKKLIDELLAEGRMTPAGLESVALAKENGSWTLLDEVEDRIIPADLETAFHSQTGAKAFFRSLSNSMQKQLLAWIVLAKRANTRQERINEIAEEAGKNQLPKPFRNT